MPQAGPEALAKLQETIRQLRTIPQLRERSPGTYQLQSQPFVQIHDVDGKLHAELKKNAGIGFDRFALDDAPLQRKFIDETKRRAAKLSDD